MPCGTNTGRRQKAKTPGSGSIFQAMMGRTAHARAARGGGGGWQESSQPARTAVIPPDVCSTAAHNMSKRPSSVCRASCMLVFLNKGTQLLRSQGDGRCPPPKGSMPGFEPSNPEEGMDMQRHSFHPKQLESFVQTHPAVRMGHTGSTSGRARISKGGREGGDSTSFPGIGVEGTQRGAAERGC